MKTARFWHANEEGLLQCDLCPHGCRLSEGKTGLCRVRTVVDGVLRATCYGRVASVGLDPIEKKPLYHFHPGSMIFSIGGWGCNFACSFCQNWSISQRAEPEGPVYRPEDLVRQAQERGSIGVAYTYNEPIVGIEFVLDCARLVHEAGMVNVLVSNGYILPGPASELLPLMDALNIDIKSMDEDFYRRHCRGKLRPVLDFVKQAGQHGCRVEITNLIIPGLNDEDGGLRALSSWMRANLGETAPLHFSAYHPDYKLHQPATPLETLMRACQIARKDLLYVYLGNVICDVGQNTDCPGCGKRLVERFGYHTTVTGLRDGVCAGCGRRADIVA